MSRVLIVEDDEVARDLLVEVLRRAGHEVAACDSAEAALEQVNDQRPELVLTDVRLGATDGITLLRTLKRIDPRIEVVVMTAFGSLPNAIEAVRAGAYDYLSKPFDLQALRDVVERALRERRDAVTVESAPTEEGVQMLGHTAAMTDVFKSIARVGPMQATVLIQGETGTGKELAARAIHDASDRATGPYVTINCPSLPEGLLESELFGHVRGAFTGATDTRPGLFQVADGGSILLDEIGDMPASTQAKLLRVLETGEVRSVGATQPRQVDVRVLAATHQDLDAAVLERRFRQDLLYRLNTVTITLPPLRERGTDILLLANHFLVRHAAHAKRACPTLGKGAQGALERYPWPGNVRELSHVVERAVAMCRGTHVGRDDLPPALRQPTPTGSRATSPAQRLEDIERAHILSVLESVGGARSKAAALLGIDRKTLYRKLLRYGVVSDGDDEES